MRKGISKRISALVSLLLVVTVLFSGSVFASGANLKPANEEEAQVMALASRNVLYVNKITVYPAYIYSENGYSVFFEDVKASQSYSFTSLAGMNITASTRQLLANQLSAKGYTQNGWHVKIDYKIDSDSPRKIEGTAGSKSFSEYAYSGNDKTEYDVVGVDSTLTWSGVLSFLQNGIGTSLFNAVIRLK